ncbi:hypothetical protein ABZ905_08700 [Streptomyces parvus]|uniref:hypothetical protein n=1 Tax=Streptomyces parvus TaxID=66428 RepID=UPI0034016699
MDPLARFLLGAACGVIASGITYAITQDPPWWWAVGLIVAIFVWFRELILELLP